MSIDECDHKATVSVIYAAVLKMVAAPSEKNMIYGNDVGKPVNVQYLKPTLNLPLK
jgi:hypothetical protein